MGLTLMYITNNPNMAIIAQKAGVDRIWIDIESIGKEERQFGLDTVKSFHSLNDILKIKPILTTSQLMVRINPLYDNSKYEIDKAIEYGADYIMLPMYRTREDVEAFIKLVNNRTKIILLLETVEADKNLESYISFPEIDEIHIGLNDLHLAYNKTFMFELLIDGTIERLSNLLNKHNKRFGFGGIARIGYGMLPAEKIIFEHYLRNSKMAILSRSFCNANNRFRESVTELEIEFFDEVRKIREVEKIADRSSIFELENNHIEITNIISKIICNKEK